MRQRDSLITTLGLCVAVLAVVGGAAACGQPLQAGLTPTPTPVPPPITFEVDCDTDPRASSTRARSKKAHTISTSISSS